MRCSAAQREVAGVPADAGRRQHGLRRAGRRRRDGRARRGRARRAHDHDDRTRGRASNPSNWTCSPPTPGRASRSRSGCPRSAGSPVSGTRCSPRPGTRCATAAWPASTARSASRASWSTALREYRGAVDLVVVGAGTVTGAVAMVYRDQAVVCRQSLSDERAATVQVARVPADALSDELAGLIAVARARVGHADHVAARCRRRRVAAAQEARPTPPPPGATCASWSATCGGDEAVVDQLLDLFPALTGRGQLGVVRRSGTTVTRPREVSWLDSPRGRVRVDQGDDGWVSVNPLRHNELVRASARLAACSPAGDTLIRGTQGRKGEHHGSSTVARGLPGPPRARRPTAPARRARACARSGRARRRRGARSA